MVKVINSIFMHILPQKYNNWEGNRKKKKKQTLFSSTTLGFIFLKQFF